MKALDPGSVVRESEFATAAKAGSYGERIKAQVERVTSGKLLSDDMRKDFVDRAGKLFQAQLGSHTKLEDEFSRIAKQRGLTPSDIVVDYVGDLRTKGTKDAPAAVPAAVKNLTDDEIMKRLRGAVGR